MKVFDDIHLADFPDYVYFKKDDERIHFMKTDILDEIKADVINIADGRRSISVRSVIKIIDKHKEERKVEE